MVSSCLFDVMRNVADVPFDAGESVLCGIIPRAHRSLMTRSMIGLEAQNVTDG